MPGAGEIRRMVKIMYRGKRNRVRSCTPKLTQGLLVNMLTAPVDGLKNHVFCMGEPNQYIASVKRWNQYIVSILDSLQGMLNHADVEVGGVRPYDDYRALVLGPSHALPEVPGLLLSQCHPLAPCGEK